MPLQFSDLGIHKELQKRLIDLEISVPTEVQHKVIPFILEKKKDLAKIITVSQLMLIISLFLNIRYIYKIKITNL